MAAWLITWSIAGRMKLIVMISITGRSPSMAAPMPAPTKPSSEIGVSRTRRGPYFCHSPAVTL